MKKFTFLLMLLSVTFGYSQTPTDNPAAPTNDAADVISIYGDTYTSIATNYDPAWGQTGHTQVDPAYDPGTGELLLAYPNFNYQGTELVAQNAANMEFLHVDIWTAADPNATNIQVSPINNGSGAGEFLVDIEYTSGTWSSVDIPKSAFTGMTWDSVFQMKFAANGPGSTVPVDIYLDNIYFYKVPVDPLTDATLSDLQIEGSTVVGFSSSTTEYEYEVASGTVDVPQITAAPTTNPNATTNITQATAIPGTATVVVTAENGTDTETYTISIVGPVEPTDTPPAPPARAAADVISIYGDAYGAEVGMNNVPWDDPTEFTEVNVAGNDVLKLDVGGFMGSSLGTVVDASEMTHFHMDFWVADDFSPGQVFNPKLSNHAEGTGETNALETTVALGPDDVQTWVSFDMELTAFNDVDANGDNAPYERANIAEFLLSLAGTIDVAYLDNVYFHKNTTLSSNEVTLKDFKVSPNPTNTRWNIRANNLEITSVKVYDILGKEVVRLLPNATEVSVDASQLKDGIYLAKISSANGTRTIKLVKN